MEHEGRLSLQKRPEEVISWGHQRNSVPLITNLQQFQEKWIIWRGSCQPKWRSTQTWPYSHEDTEGKDWAWLDVTGPHGLFAIIMSTSWWAIAVDPNSHGVFNAAVNDLLWVMENLIKTNSQLQVTRPECIAAMAANFPGHSKQALSGPLYPVLST